jgi:GntR family transcriptional regulator
MYVHNNIDTGRDCLPLRTMDLNLNANNPTPLYYQLKQQILEKITKNDLKVNEQIPNEMELVEGLGVSRSTIRQAINELVVEGYLYRKKTKGTFVSHPKVNENFLQVLDSFNHEMILKGFVPSTKVLALNVVEGMNKINEKLNLNPESKLICLSRLRLANGEPIVIVNTYLPFAGHEGLLDYDFASKSLYNVLETIYNQRVVRAVRKIEAINASQKDIKMLCIQANAAILLVESIAYTQFDIPVEYSVAKYRGDRNKFEVELKR